MAGLKFFPPSSWTEILIDPHSRSSPQGAFCCRVPPSDPCRPGHSPRPSAPPTFSRARLHSFHCRHPPFLSSRPATPFPSGGGFRPSPLLCVVLRFSKQAKRQIFFFCCWLAERFDHAFLADIPTFSWKIVTFFPPQALGSPLFRSYDRGWLSSSSPVATYFRARRIPPPPVFRLSFSWHRCLHRFVPSGGFRNFAVAAGEGKTFS